MNYKVLMQIEQEENIKLKQELAKVKSRNQELELRLKHIKQPAITNIFGINLVLLRGKDVKY